MMPEVRALHRGAEKGLDDLVLREPQRVHRAKPLSYWPALIANRSGFSNGCTCTPAIPAKCSAVRTGVAENSIEASKPAISPRSSSKVE